MARALPALLRGPLVCQPLRGAWTLHVRCLTPAEEVRLIDSLMAMLEGDAPARLLSTLAIDLCVGLESPTFDGDAGGRGNPIEVRLHPVFSEPDKPVPLLPASLVSEYHRAQVAGALVQSWLGAHSLRQVWAGVDLSKLPACPGEPVATSVGLLSARPLSVPDCDHKTIQQAQAALIASYLMAGKTVPPEERAGPDLDEMARHAARAVTHRYCSEADEWVPFRLVADYHADGDAWTGALTPSCVVRLHEVASLHLLEASSYVAPWVGLGPAILGMGQSPAPFEVDDDTFQALAPTARQWARVGWATAWAMEHDKRIAAALPGAGMVSR